MWLFVCHPTLESCCYISLLSTLWSCSASMSFLEEALLGGAVSTQGSFFGLSWLQRACNACWCPIVFTLCSGLPLWRINKNDKEQPSSLFNFPMKQYLLFVLLIFYVPGIPLALSVLSQPTCCSSLCFLIATCCCMAVSVPSLAMNSSFVAFSDSFFPSVVLLFILSFTPAREGTFLTHRREESCCNIQNVLKSACNTDLSFWECMWSHVAAFCKTLQSVHAKSSWFCLCKHKAILNYRRKKISFLMTELIVAFSDALYFYKILMNTTFSMCSPN